MTIEKLREVLIDYRELINPRNNTVGSVLKHYRLEKGLTLEEASHGSCSISYLSKVENNQLAPSDKILDKLIKKLNIDNSSFSKTEKDTAYIEEILKVEYVPTKVYTKYINQKDYQAKIVEFAHAVLNNEDTKAAKEINASLMEYYIFFNDDEMAFYFYVLMNLNYLNEQYEVVVKLYNEVYHLYDKLKLKVKSALLTIKSLYRLERFSEAGNFLKANIDDFYKLNLVDDINKIIEYEFSAIARFKNTETIQHEMDLLVNNKAIDTKLIWFNHYFYYLENYEKSLSLIDEIKYKNEYCFINYLICLDKLNKEEQIKIALKDEMLNDLRPSYLYIVKLLKDKYCKQNNLNRLKQELHYINYITHEFIVVRFVYEYLVSELKKKFLYKEALEICGNLAEEYKKRTAIMVYP